MLGREFEGTIGCDYFSAYRKYMKDFNVLAEYVNENETLIG
jgi:hypothetical protein